MLEDCRYCANNITGLNRGQVPNTSQPLSTTPSPPIRPLLRLLTFLLLRPEALNIRINLLPRNILLRPNGSLDLASQRIALRLRVWSGSITHYDVFLRLGLAAIACGLAGARGLVGHAGGCCGDSMTRCASGKVRLWVWSIALGNGKRSRALRVWRGFDDEGAGWLPK